MRSYSSVHAGAGFDLSVLDSTQAWSAGEAVAGVWMQIQLDSVQPVAGVVIQGRNSIDVHRSQYVKQFTVTWADNWADQHNTR